ncbi:hypothetical protein N7471_002304 [Penicillium samsonianum]|uniref:uncharacterized protein n=1 Tax=Penicillium samsonianum TaxID=1882272 RepID=UPI002548D7B0|nr:uncharacterized protein N7471_002304 [Penicillium samsonianum]KAJ6142851.1 hypothetical protein N7471_002304 [Penicillium samsonianum]
MSDGVGESHRFPPIDGLHDRCCNISNERCRRAPLDLHPLGVCLRNMQVLFLSELSLHTPVLELLIRKDFIPRELLVWKTYPVSACVNSYSDCNPSVDNKSRANTPEVKAQEIWSNQMQIYNFKSNYTTARVPDSGLVFFLLVSGLWISYLLTPRSAFLFLAFAHCSALFLSLSSLTQFSRSFPRSCHFAPCDYLKTRLWYLHSPLDCPLIPALRPRKFPRLIGPSHNLPGLHSSNLHCFKVYFAFYLVACFALRTEATTSSNRLRAGSSLD